MTLPYNESNDVKVFANEYVNGNTINRALLRLFYNDTYLSNLSALNPVDAPVVANSLLISVSPTEYTWKNGEEVKTLLGLTDSMFGLSDVDASEITIENTQALVWDAASTAFIAQDFVTTLNGLSDVTINAASNLQSLIYSDDYGKWINGSPSDFTVGYVTNISAEVDTRINLPATTAVGRQLTITKYGSTTDLYVVPNAVNLINGQAKTLISNVSSETSSTMHLRTILRADSSVEWVTLGGDGSWEFINTAIVPGSGIEIRDVTDDDLMLAPYDVTIENVPDASETTAGIIRIATYAEGIAGILTDVCVNPYQLKYFMDNYTVPFASDVEAAAGLSEITVINPYQLQNEIAANSIGGRVDDDGTILFGRGFTCVKSATGKYTITFDTVGIWVITATADDTGYSDPYVGGTIRVAQIMNQTSSSVEIWIKHENKYAGYTASYTDQPFNIIGIKI